jgi:SAM-dependent methyltransferase
MMLGLRESFEYFECGGCSSLQIGEIPRDMARYYPSHYYSYGDPPAPRLGPLGRWLKRRRDAGIILRRDLLGRLLSRVRPAPSLAPLGELGLRRNTRILDVGSGAGHLLGALEGIGFVHLLGIEPYLPADRVPVKGPRVLRRTLFECRGTFDLVMFHHSFEHVPDPAGTLRHVAGLLAPRGTCLLRVPTASSYAWREYRTDWVQLDAPRHFHLFSIEGLARLAEATGFRVARSWDVSSAFQFWGSEQYQMDIPLLSDRSYARNPGASPFGPAQIREFERRAERLNARREGDEIAVCLKRA